MRLYILLVVLASFGARGVAQSFFPVKINKKWGLINSEGQLVLPPEYDAIGEFKYYGCAIMQRQGKVGLLGPDGSEAIGPAYEDIKVLDSALVAVMEQGEWMVINRLGQTILPKGYQRVTVISGGYLAYLRNNKWGLVDNWGHQLAQPLYDEILPESKGFFLTRVEDRLGLITDLGKEVLPNVASEIRLLNDSLILYRKGNFWGGVDNYGIERFAPRFDGYKSLDDYFIRLEAGSRFFLYSLTCRMVVGGQDFDDFYAFSPRHVIVKKNRKLGLMSWCGELVLKPVYDEIQPFSAAAFRVNTDGRWGVADGGDRPLIQLAYEYISPLTDNICLVKQGGKFGVFNAAGKEQAAPQYDLIELEPGAARAYLGNGDGAGGRALVVLRFDAGGNLQDNNQFNRHFQVKVAGKNTPENRSEYAYQLEKYEWFYSPVNDRWGLRRLADGGVEIEPIFQTVQVEKDLGFTLVGLAKSNYYDFERTTFRFDMVYGLVLNAVGKPVTDIDLLHLHFEDFRAGNPLARCVFSNGKYGLIDRTGRIVRRDLAYIGVFSDGLARFGTSGRLSGSLKPGHALGSLSAYLSSLITTGVMTDYTDYDHLLRREGSLVCEGCTWGYLDTLGVVAAMPEYDFSLNFVNGVGIVSGKGKWGMINRQGKIILPCQYDGIEFLPNTGNRMVRVYIQEPRYGLIDTLGQLRVRTMYDQLGSFAEGRLAVNNEDNWGFVNIDGLEVIPCRFREVQNFQEGLAAVRLGRSWGYVDKQGEVEIDFQYRRASSFSGGMAAVSVENGKVGYINRKNDFVIPPRFDRAYDFYKGVARVVEDGKFSLIDTAGRYVSRQRFNDIGAFNPHGLAVVSYGNERIRYGLINIQGQLVTSDDFQAIEPFSEGLAVAKTKDGYGYIDTSGRIAIPCKYSRAGAFSEGRATVQLAGQCGYIDAQGQEIIPCQYSRCQDFSGGRAVVYQGIRKAGILGPNGEQIVEPSLDRLLKFQEGRGLMRDDAYRFYYITEQSSQYDAYYQHASAFRHGVAVVQVNGKWGIINQKGIEIIPPKYDWIDNFDNGFARVKIQGYNGLSNLEGEIIVKPNYEIISYAGEGLFRVEQGDQIGYFDAEGKWVWNLSN